MMLLDFSRFLFASGISAEMQTDDFHGQEGDRNLQRTKNSFNSVLEMLNECRAAPYAFCWCDSVPKKAKSMGKSSKWVFI